MTIAGAVGVSGQAPVASLRAGAPLTCGDRFDAGAPAASNTRSVGRTRVFTWNPRYPFLDPLRALLASAMEYLPASEVQAYFRKRTRPRHSGKPL